MNKRNFYLITCLWIVIFPFVVNKANAQCNDIQLLLTATNPTCFSNGQIKVTLAGSDVSNLELTTYEFSVEGTNAEGTISRPWARYQSNGDVITGLPYGTYSIYMRAFCQANNEWFVTTHSTPIMLTSSYNVLDAFTGTVRTTLNCKPTGMVPISVRATTGTTPFTITIKSITGNTQPYVGPMQFILSRTNYNTTVTQNIDNLPAGYYTFEVEDSCLYTQTVYASVGTMPQDYATDMFYNYLYPSYYTTDCNTVSFVRFNPVGRTPDQSFYFNSNIGTYYDLGVQLNGTGPIDWLIDTLSNFYVDYTLPSSLSIFRANGDFYTPWVRVKGTGCEFQLRNAYVYAPPNHNITYSNITCTDATVNHLPYGTYYSLFCNPYRWRIIRINGSDTTEVAPYTWSGWIPDNTRQIANNIPYSSFIQFEDSQGYRWIRGTIGQPGYTPVYSSYPCTNQGITNNYFHTYSYFYLTQIDSIPAGTTIEYLPPVPPELPHNTPPYHQYTVFNNTSANRFYPFSVDSSLYDYTYIEPGIYQFLITLPGVGCTPIPVNLYHSVHKLITPMSYTTYENCGGLVVKFTGGQLGQETYYHTTSNLPTRFFIHSVTPSVPFDASRVYLGDSVVFTTSGRYVIAMTYENNAYSSCPLITDTIDYVKTPFTLNSAITSAYLCEDSGGGGTGFIRVQGMGGSGNYKYELYDSGPNPVQDNNTGVFYYGTAGNDYTIKLIDIDPSCAASYEQTVHMINLSGAEIVYSSSPTNTFCVFDSIYLKCITLGQTTYTWSGDGITSANEHMQNPVIAAADVGVGTHTYSINVTPEGCGQMMQQSITITVDECGMAKDATLILTPDSFVHRGTRGNPVAVLYGDTILYEITARNTTQSTSVVTVRDTLPYYLNLVAGSAVTVPTGLATITTGRTPAPFQRDTLRWVFSGVPTMASRTARFKATPQAGAVASQPLYDNRAWVQVGNELSVATNYTYHQGADVSFVTFSAGFGGNLYNATEQVLDYRTTPHSGIVITPDEGYRFAGWSHPDYLSLRGETIPANDGIMLYDTLTIYGNVNLYANFEPEEYPISYYLNGGNWGNPASPTPPILYTIESQNITLPAPEKEGDVFTGWTGSNGDEPQQTVTIPKGSTGKRFYYANYLLSGREGTTYSPQVLPDEDNIWVFMGELHIYTSKPNCVVKIYTSDGILRYLQTILTAGETKIKLPQGVYIVTLNNNAGKKIIIN